MVFLPRRQVFSRLGELRHSDPSEIGTCEDIGLYRRYYQEP